MLDKSRIECYSQLEKCICSANLNKQQEKECFEVYSSCMFPLKEKSKINNNVKGTAKPYFYESIKLSIGGK